jgi:hypothetical protein
MKFDLSVEFLSLARQYPFRGSIENQDSGLQKFRGIAGWKHQLPKLHQMIPVKRGRPICLIQPQQSSFVDAFIPSTDENPSFV